MGVGEGGNMHGVSWRDAEDVGGERDMDWKRLRGWWKG